jgi:CDP-paratose 2-epimerase
MSRANAPVLITGGAGFIGCNLAAHLARSGRRVRIYDDLSRAGVDRNLAWLSSHQDCSSR